MQNSALRALIWSVQRRLFTTSISGAGSKGTVDYLVNSCGLAKETAIYAAQKVEIKKKNLEKCGSIFSFLRERGFSDAQLQQLVKKYPKILNIRLDGLKRKMEFLNESRLKGLNLVELLVSNPIILKRGVKSRLLPSLEFLMKHVGSIERVEMALKRASWLLTINLELTMQPIIDLLISEGVTLDAINWMVATKPRAALLKPDSMARAVKAVKELGVEPSSRNFIHAVCVKVQMSEATWNGKFDIFRSLGWADDEIVSAFVRYPGCLKFSEEKIRAVTQFIVETMKLNQAFIIANPKFLGFSIESRYKPRFFVLNKLKSENLVKDDLKCHWLMKIEEHKFLENYVKKYAVEVPDLMETYTSMRVGKLVH